MTDEIARLGLNIFAERAIKYSDFYEDEDTPNNRIVLHIVLANRTELPVIVDTGSPWCVLDPLQFEKIIDYSHFTRDMKLNIRGESYTGGLYRIPIHMEAIFGKSLEIDAAVFGKKHLLFDVFGFLSDALQNNMTVAVNRRGGFSELITRGCNPEKDFISIEIEFSHPETECCIYSIETGQKSGKAVIQSEGMKYRHKETGQLLNILEFKEGKGRGAVIEKGIKQETNDYSTASTDILAIKGLGQFERFKSVSSFRALLEKWYISNFRIEYGRNISDTGISAHLSASGDNLAQVTKFIYENHPDIFENILKKLPLRIPGISKVEARETEDGRIVLRFQDEHFKDPFISRYMPDGTIKMFAYMILLYDPEPHPLLCIEEPENFLHPDLLPELCLYRFSIDLMQCFLHIRKFPGLQKTGFFGKIRFFRRTGRRILHNFNSDLVLTLK